MPPFNRSTLTYAAAQSEVAGSAGVSTSEMLARAGNSLDAVAQKWNRMRWLWLRSEQFISLAAPITVTGCTTTVDTLTVTTTVPNGFLSVLVDDVATGGGLRPDTLVGATGATALTMVASASATVTGASLVFKRAFYPLNSDFKTIFDARIMGSPRPVHYWPRRQYDNYADQTGAGDVSGYDLYPVLSKGKIRILPAPSAPETLWLKYYRRILMPSTTVASGLDVPEDYEDVFIAAAKAHFLADKGQPHREQWMFWNEYAKAGIKEMRVDERIIEDEDLTLQPPHPRRIYGVNSPFFYEGY